MIQTAAKTSNAIFGRFYTNREVGDMLVRSMTSRPERIVDLGAGKGSLALAVARQWKSTEIVTVDIDRRVLPRLIHESLLTFQHRHTHITADVLDHSLPDLLLRGARKFDAAVCNPPYITPVWKPTFEHILEDAGLSCVLKNGGVVGADVLFTAQNLRLTQEGGELGLIVPDGIVTGRKLASLRRALIGQHCIRNVVQLPRGCFKGTEAQAFIVIFEKSRHQSETIRLTRLTADGGTSDPIFIDAGRAEDRCDYAYYATRPIIRKATFTLRDAKACIVRGSLHSGEAKRSGHKYFHTSSFPEVGSKKLRFPLMLPKLRKSSLVIAEAGDILIARVDRNLHLKVAIVASGRAILTDCIFRVRIPKAWRARVFRALSSRNGAQALDAIARGVGARLVTKESLFCMGLS